MDNDVMLREISYGELLFCAEQGTHNDASRRRAGVLA